MGEILIIGGGGMVGQKLAHALADNPLHAGDQRHAVRHGVSRERRTCGQNGSPAM